jgi:outer membrane protein
MRKMSSVKLLLVGVFLYSGLAIVLFSGCAHFHNNESSGTLKVTSEQLHQIEPLELKAAPKEEESAKPKTEELAPASLEISLELCRAWALENNLDLKAQLISPSIAEEGVNQENARFESIFSVNVNYSKINQPAQQTLIIAGNKYDITTNDLDVAIPLRTGGLINFDLIEDRVKTNSLFSIMNPSYESNFSASISQPLLRNAGMRVNEHSIRIAEYNAQIIDAETKIKAIYLLADVDRYYWKLYEARRMLDVRKQQYEQAKALYDETEAFVKVGSKAQIELIRTRASMASKLEAIISAENDVRNIERYLKMMLNRSGLGAETTTTLIPTTEPNPVHFEINGDNMISKAVDNRMELLELELQLAQDSDNINYYKNQTFPSLGFEYRYSINGLGSSRRDSYDLLRENNFHDQRFGLALSIPLGNGAARSRLRQATYERAQRLANRDTKKAQIKSEVLNQIDNLEASWQMILAARQTTIYYDQQYQAEKRQYELGTVKSTDVLTAQTDLAEAQRAEICALADYQIALVDLAYATGTTLSAAKVQWEPFVPEK